MSRMAARLFLTTAILAISFNFAHAAEADLFCQPANSVPVACAVDGANILQVSPVSGGSGVAVTATIANGTITLTDTFQAALAAPGAGTTRKACLLQNQATANTMYIYAGAIGGATKAKSIQILPGSAYTCGNISGGVEQSAVNITGTTADAWIMWSE